MKGLMKNQLKSSQIIFNNFFENGEYDDLKINGINFTDIQYENNDLICGFVHLESIKRGYESNLLNIIGF